VNVNPYKLIGWAGLAVCIVGAFVEIPYASLILVVAGVAVGVSIATEDSVRVIVTALALTSLSSVLMNVPAIGEILTKIFSAAGVLTSGAALSMIGRNMWNRFKP